MTRCILPIILFLVGLGVSAIGLVLFVRTRAFLEHSQTAQGRYVDVSANDPTGVPERTVTYPIVEFQTTDGRTIRFEARSGDLSAGRKVGQTVPVRYDPRDPSKAIVDTFVETWLPVLIPLLTGLLLACGALIGGVILLSR
jgi:hypothetical protein